VLGNVGATRPKRDTVDSRIVNEVMMRTATYSGHTHYYETKHGLSTSTPHGIIDSQNDVGGWPLLISDPAPSDSDHDGMPDDWETAHQMNPNDDSDRNTIASNGYTMLEKYLAELAGDDIALSVREISSAPSSFQLMQNYPNPFNPVTTISFTVAKQGLTTLKVFNTLGQEVAVLFHGNANAGASYSVLFKGEGLASGLYFSVLESGGQWAIRKMVLLK